VDPSNFLYLYFLTVWHNMAFFVRKRKCITRSFTDVCPHTSTYSFSVSPCTYYFNHLYAPTTTYTTFVFFWVPFCLPSFSCVYFTHRNITFVYLPLWLSTVMLPAYKNVFYFTSLAPRSIFIPGFCFSPTLYVFVSLTFRIRTFLYPIIWRS